MNSDEQNDSSSPAVDDEATIVAAISTRAYYLWESAGRPDGRDDDFWFQAESEFAEQPKP